MLAAVHTQGRLDPAIDAPPDTPARAWAREEAVIELVRLRLQGPGAGGRRHAVAASLGFADDEVEAALTALESEGFVLRGQFTPRMAGRTSEWCERRLLARIHRYTISTLRAEIEPVRRGLHALSARLAGRDEAIRVRKASNRWRRSSHSSRGMRSRRPPGKSDVLPARMHEYDPNWLDSLFGQSGRALWARLTPAKGDDRRPRCVRTPITLLTRKKLALLWQSLTVVAARRHAALRILAQALVEHLPQYGASFFDDIVGGTGLAARAGSRRRSPRWSLPGLVNADSYSGLRALLIPSERSTASRLRDGDAIALFFGLEDAGRWESVWRAGNASLGRRVRSSRIARDPAPAATASCSVVLLEREAEWLPPWHVSAARLSKARGAGERSGADASWRASKWRAIRAPRGGRRHCARCAGCGPTGDPIRPVRRRSAQPGPAS